MQDCNYSVFLYGLGGQGAEEIFLYCVVGSGLDRLQSVAGG